MWLIDTTSLELKDFMGIPTDKYAILSHRWMEEEVNFEEFRTGEGRGKKGFAKILHSCRIAKARGFKYAWVDTCCIDKRSSAELSEAINSMYEWYARAEECYAYLNDVHHTSSYVFDYTSADERKPIITDETQEFLKDLDHKFHLMLSRTKWITRGWTLQELLAPKKVVFFDSEWQPFGSRKTLCSIISNVTGIHVDVLEGRKRIGECSIAQRMSWAASRVTTRREDMAYSLLGIFDVNMPLLYGEGKKAFRRLQEAIIQQSEDESIFAWKMSNISKQNFGGLLAPTVKAFKESGDILMRSNPFSEEPYNMTNRGLRLNRKMVPWRMNTFILPLQCSRMSDIDPHEPSRIGILICMGTKLAQCYRVSLDNESLYLIHFWMTRYPVIRPASSGSQEWTRIAGELPFVSEDLPLNLVVVSPDLQNPPPFGHHKVEITIKDFDFAGCTKGTRFVCRSEFEKTINRPAVVHLPDDAPARLCSDGYRIVMKSWLYGIILLPFHNYDDQRGFIKQVQIGFDYNFTPMVRVVVVERFGGHLDAKKILEVSSSPSMYDPYTEGLWQTFANNILARGTGKQQVRLSEAGQHRVFKSFKWGSEWKNVGSEIIDGLLRICRPTRDEVLEELRITLRKSERVLEPDEDANVSRWEFSMQSSNRRAAAEVANTTIATKS